MVEAWSELTHHHYRHLPVVDGDGAVGVVSLRDLLGVARSGPPPKTSAGVPRGSRASWWPRPRWATSAGREGFFHYRQYSAVELAARRSLEDVWHLLFEASSPTGPTRRLRRRRRPACGSSPRAWPRSFPLGLGGLAPRRPAHRGVAARRRARLARRPTTSTAGSSKSRRSDSVRVVPTCSPPLIGSGQGHDPIAPATDLVYAANYLWM